MDITVDIITSHPQFVLLRVRTNNTKDYGWVSIVHASPSHDLHKKMYRDLDAQNLNIKGLWLSIGD